MGQALIMLSQDDLKEMIFEAVKLAIAENSYPSQTEQHDELLDRKSAAKLLNITPTTLSTYVKQGKIVHGGTDRKYMFRKSDLVKFMFNR